MRSESYTPRHENTTASGTMIPIMEHLTALKALEDKYISRLNKAEDKFQAERDRRYSEINIEKEKALNIKETADLAALQLAREIQTYKDEKANELREQISRERGLYATQSDLRGVVEKMEAIIKPINEFVSSQQGGNNKSKDMLAIVVGAVGMIGVVITAVVLLIK